MPGPPVYVPGCVCPAVPSQLTTPLRMRRMSLGGYPNPSSMPRERSKQSKISEAVVMVISGLVLMAFVHWGFGLVVFVGLLMLFGPADVARGK